jgi:hypothetical protein
MGWMATFRDFFLTLRFFFVFISDCVFGKWTSAGAAGTQHTGLHSVIKELQRGANYNLCVCL